MTEKLGIAIKLTENCFRVIHKTPHEHITVLVIQHRKQIHGKKYSKCLSWTLSNETVLWCTRLETTANKLMKQLAEKLYWCNP